MNWLAHALLSPPDPHVQLGNLAADMIRRDEQSRLPKTIQQGIVLHRQIDRFTDSHPLVKHSRQRLPAPWRRFAGILVDVYYDHLLALTWQDYHPHPLPVFTRTLYQGIAPDTHLLPEFPRQAMDYMIETDILGGYLAPQAVALALERISRRLNRRWQRALALENSLPELLSIHSGLEEDFKAFFPELIAFAHRQIPDVQARALSTRQTT